MVSTRGNRDNDNDSKLHLPPRECRKPRTTLQEPEDEMFWESDDNSTQVKRRTRKSGVTFQDKNLTSIFLSTDMMKSEETSKFKSNESGDESEKENTSRLLSGQSDDMNDGEVETDTDDELFPHRRLPKLRQNLRNSRSGRLSSHSPIKKEFVMNGDDEMTDKSDHESGLRRSSRQRKSASYGQSWLFGDKKLKGYPNMINSSEPENDEPRPSRKASRYIHSSNEKNVLSSSLPQRRVLRSRQKSGEQRSRSHDYLRRDHPSRKILQRPRRRPMRYRDSQSEQDPDDADEEEEDEDEEEEDEDEEVEDEEEEEEDEEEEKKAEVEVGTEIGEKENEEEEEKKDKPNLRAKRSRTQLAKMQSDEVVTSPSKRIQSQPAEEDSDTDDNSNLKKVGRRRKLRTLRNLQSSVGGPSIENKGNLIFEKPKRLRKPVSRLTYEPRQRRIKASSSSESKEDDDDDEEDEDGDDEEQQEDETKERGSRYSLRQNRKPLIQDPYESPTSHRHRKDRENIRTFLNSPARKHVYNKKYRAAHASTMSSSSSSSDEKEFEKRKAKSMSKARNRCLPMNLSQDDLVTGSVRDRTKIGSSLADIDPMSVDSSVSFESIGGLAHHIKSLKEMIIFPLIYPGVFEKFNVTPPRGVLFYGQPGTGKTLVARALANECGQSDKKIAFFMRKGADCLSKWVGESERQLRLLFDQAYQMRPSIIFFDEIDGLAPVRSSRQDQIHSSIVSTLLALMDGLDSRGEVVVIGATNRVDAIDPALRRPGRFDREFHFPLPSEKARKQILSIHTQNWAPKLSNRVLQYLAGQTVGYCGADLKALCAEATLVALRSKYPQIYLSKHKLQLDISKIIIKLYHFRTALSKIVPAGQRVASSPGRKLSKIVAPLAQPFLTEVLKLLKQFFPQGFCRTVDNNVVHMPRMLLSGIKGQGQTTHLAPAILHALEKVPTHKLDLPSLFSISARAPEEACAQVFHEARRNLPSIVYIPLIDTWWNTVSDTVKATFISLLNDLEPSTPLLLLATSETCYNLLEEEVQLLFSVYRKEVYSMSNPKEEQRRSFFRPVFFTEMTRKPKIFRSKNRVLEPLPIAPPPEPRKLSTHELQKIEEIEEATLRELRIFLRQICAKLAKNRMFYIFTKPVDIDEVPDYLDVISTPMDLETMMTKIDHHKYLCAQDFLKDIDLICSNALEYNPDRNPEDKLIRHRACTLRDTAYAYIKAEMDTDFEEKCRDIRRVRGNREQSTSKSAPDFIRVGPPITKLAADIAGVNNKNPSGILQSNQTDDVSRFKKKNIDDLGRKRKRRKSSWARGFLTSNKKKKLNGDEGKKEQIKDAKEGESDVNNSGDDLTKRNESITNEMKSISSGICDVIRADESSVDSSVKLDEEIEVQNNQRVAQNKVCVESNMSLCNGNLSTEDSHDSMRVTSAADLLYNKSLSDAIQKDKNNDFRIGEEAKRINLSLKETEESVVSSSEPSGSNYKNREITIDWAHLEAAYEACISTTQEATIDELQYLYTILIGLSRKHNSSIERSALLNEVEQEIRKFAQFRGKP